MKIWTLTTDTDEIATTVHITEDDAYDTLRENFAPEFDGTNDALVTELTERQGVVLYVEEHELPPLTVLAAGNPFDGLSLHGPFPSRDADLLAYYAERRYMGDWWIADLHAPENNG